MNGTATKLPAGASHRDVAQAALAVWNKRVETAQTSGKKLQQGPFTIRVTDGETFLVRPTTDGLIFYSEMPFLRVNFQRSVKVEVVAPKPSK